MFYPSTTIWHKHSNSNPLNIKEKRVVFLGLWDRLESIGKFGLDKLEGITRKPRGMIRGAVNVLTLPSKAIAYVGNKIYDYTVVPAIKAVKVVGGSTTEAVAGVKDTTVNPAVTVAKTPFIDLKMNLVDLPIHLARSAVRLPGNILRVPLRWWEGIKESCRDFVNNTKTLATNTRQNVDSVLDKLVNFRPIKTVKALAKSSRDAVYDTIINPAKNHFYAKSITKPIAPIAEGPVGGAAIAIESKTQYFSGIIKAIGEMRDGLVRIWNAPGHEWNFKALEEMIGKKYEEGKAKVIESTRAKMPKSGMAGRMAPAPA